MQADDLLPALRAIDIQPYEGDNGETQFALIDRSQFAPRPLAVSAAGYFVLAHLTGQSTCADLQSAFHKATGSDLPIAQIETLISALDDNLLLDNDRFEAAYTQRVAEYAAAPARDNRARYPAANELHAELSAIIAAGTPLGTGPLRGLVAPHLDYERGRPCYADSYATLAAAPPAERYIILGTNHNGRSHTAVATYKNFQTPLGLVPTDTAFIDALAQQADFDICAHQLDHDTEHSVELQVHLLQVALADHPFEVVPILCSAPPATWPAEVPPEYRRAATEEYTRFFYALARLLAEPDKPTVLIASADLSHVGPGFGDTDPITADTLAHVRQTDQAFIDAFQAGPADRVVAHAIDTANPTRICSVSCLQALPRVLPDADCHLGRYHQAINHDLGMHVTCFSAALY
jgi:AmmeMemoRadiSam system protein B